MSSMRQDGINALRVLFQHAGKTISSSDIKILNLPPDEANDHLEKVKEYYAAIRTGFYHCASRGIEFVNVSKLTSIFGTSLNDNYPYASDSFLKFATTYWTYKILLENILREDDNWIGVHLLGKFEQEIASVFFPTPGIIKIPNHLREKMQRDLIKESGADIKINDFIQGNPILRKQSTTGTGCLVPILFIVIILLILSF